MYGGSAKLGRGGGGGRGAGGGNKRNIHSTFHPPPLIPHRPSSSSATAPSGRLSTGSAGTAPRNRVASASAAPAASSAGTEESFNLVTGNPLNFAMIIRLAPDLVEEIKRVESQGSVARIKFDSNANNPAGNVISVGDKDFRFTWSREPGDLCDIYEERQSGEDGNGLLVESGSAWRKLNVQRVLDESTKNLVKMRSEEAERKLKSRKAIVLDHGNPSMKNNVKAMVAAESTSSWRMKGAPFKKRKPEPPPGGPPKSVQRLTTTPPPKGRPPASSPSSPPEQSIAPGSPVGGHLMKGHTDIEDTVSVQTMNKTSSSVKDSTGKLISGAGRGKQGQKAPKGTQPADLRSMLISLLGECPSKGISLKALEKAIGDAIPNSVRQIEPILKKIATFQAPGRYFLKPGVEIENCKKPLSEGQSSPEDNLPSPVHDGQQPAIDTTSVVNEIEHSELGHKYEETHNLVERGDVSHHSTDLFGEKKVADKSEGPVGSSSDSGSDSDSESDSSDSGSDSGTHSRSRSKSAGGSGSGSSSDSESDASTKSKEASDEDVDIMTSDDDKQVKHKLEASAIGSFKSPRRWSTSDGEHARMGSDEKQDSHANDLIEIERDFTEDQSVRGVAVPSDSVRNQDGQKTVEETTPLLYCHNEDQERQESAAKIVRETGNISKDGFKRGQSDSSEKASRGKYKRVLEERHEDRSDRSKKLKSGNSRQPLVSGSRTAPFQGSHQNLSPDRPFEDLNREPNNLITNRLTKGINSGFGSRKSYDQTSPGKSLSDSQPPIQRSIDPSSRVKSSSSLERPGKHSDSMGRDAKHPDKIHQMTEGFQMEKDKFNREVHDVHSSSGHKGPITVSKEDFVEKHTTPADTRQKRHESFGNLKEFGSVSNSPKDENSNGRDRAVNGRPNVLQRELSDLEMGELRESLPEETSGFGKQLNRKSSFKQSENKALSSESWNPDSSKSKLVSKMAIDSRKPSPPYAHIPVSEGMSKRGIPEHVAGDNSKPNMRGMQIQPPRYQSRVDNIDIGIQPNRVVELSGRNRHGDARASLDTTPEVHGNFPSKGLATMPQEHEAKQGAAPLKKESRRQKSNAIPDLNDKQKDSSLTGSSDGCQKRMESSSDENSCPYSKYEKDEPELKGPIKDFSQYKEYVDEFQEKHVIYGSINKILQSYGEEFLKYERDLEASKGKDMERYNNVARQIKESYRRCGERFQRLKKIFVVLHEELRHLKQMIREFSSQYL